MIRADSGNHSGARRSAAPRVWMAVILGLLLLAGAAWSAHVVAGARIRARLLQTPADAAADDPQLVAAAMAQARPLFATNCAGCHGAGMRGDQRTGTPDLTDGVWLYGSGSVFDIERTILYGARAAMPRSRNVSEMPPFGLTGILRPDEIREVVQYLLQLSGRPHDGQAALAGRELFFGQANCVDCHGPDGKGNSDYGAPDLTVNVWNSGGDPANLYDSIYFGRHRVMPGWIDRLTLEQIRALSVYIHAISHPARAAGSSR
ncbi:MAG TPA: c-type cytochrome [Steroidobacteraceae bacterium]|nr:c-type cytochrome [Steroidobacteraceae bacterium]